MILVVFDEKKVMIERHPVPEPRNVKMIIETDILLSFPLFSLAFSTSRSSIGCKLENFKILFSVQQSAATESMNNNKITD